MKTKIYIKIGLVLMALTSCHILSKQKQTLQKISHKEQMQLAEQRITKSQQSQLLLVDSSHNDFTMLLWPKGKFTFSVANGFEGEAEKILIKGKQVSKKVLNLNEETKKDSILLEANYSNQSKSIAMVQKNKFRVGYSWTWLLIVPILWMSYRLYKRLK